jgi:hypothetical protein
MKLELCHEIMACLPQGRTIFRYGKDHYAFYLLRRAVAEGSTVARLRQSDFAPLLEKPLVRAWLAGRGKGLIGPDDIPDPQWRQDGIPYLLSLGIWGKDTTEWAYNQVSRRGASLVLHLNQSNFKSRALPRFMAQCGKDPFSCYYHPEAGGMHPTIAWARLDIDLERREALIEELQTDRIRFVQNAAKNALRSQPGELVWCRSQKVKRETVLDYWEHEMKRHAAIWDEAMLTATLDFLHREIGIRRVFYHSFEGGCFLKHIRYSKPPRSLYTTLPRRFCFQLTDEIPRMLAECRTWKNRPAHKRRELRFHLLTT